MAKPLSDTQIAREKAHYEAYLAQIAKGKTEAEEAEIERKAERKAERNAGIG